MTLGTFWERIETHRETLELNSSKDSGNHFGGCGISLGKGPKVIVFVEINDIEISLGDKTLFENLAVIDLLGSSEGVAKCIEHRLARRA